MSTNSNGTTITNAASSMCWDPAAAAASRSLAPSIGRRASHRRVTQATWQNYFSADTCYTGHPYRAAQHVRQNSGHARWTIVHQASKMAMTCQRMLEEPTCSAPAFDFLSAKVVWGWLRGRAFTKIFNFCNLKAQLSFRQSSSQESKVDKFTSALLSPPSRVFAQTAEPFEMRVNKPTFNVPVPLCSVSDLNYHKRLSNRQTKWKHKNQFSVSHGNADNCDILNSTW